VSPSLQYIQIGLWAWQVFVKENSASVIEVEPLDHFKLVELTAAETLAVDLFAMEKFPGLTGPKKYIPRYSEVEYEKMNETQRDFQ